MYHIVTIVIIIAAAIVLVRYLRQQPTATRQSLLIKYIIYGIIGLTIILALTGRVHWLGAAIAAMIPAVGKLAFWGLRFLPFLQQWRANRHHRNKPPTTKTMNYEEALALFGLTATANREQIIQRHRELMQKNHPDRGGSNYLATKINEAKKILLQALKK